MTRSAAPRVSIGLPVYNGAAVLHTALDSLLAQTFADFELVISDNFSSDSTEQICRAYAAKDDRIRYVRQPQNIGAAENFRFVLASSGAEYFLWHAADDIRSPDFVEVNLRFLDANPGYVAATSPTRFANGEFDPKRMGDAPLEGTPEENFLRFFCNTWHANGRFYSLFRREILANCRSLRSSYFGNDWAVVLECCLEGRFHRCEQGWTVVGKGGLSQGTRRFSAFRNNWYDRVAPVADLSKVVWSMSSTFSPTTRAKLAIILLRLNASGTWASLRVELGRLASVGAL